MGEEDSTKSGSSVLELSSSCVTTSSRETSPPPLINSEEDNNNNNDDSTDNKSKWNINKLPPEFYPRNVLQPPHQQLPPFVPGAQLMPVPQPIPLVGPYPFDFDQDSEEASVDSGQNSLETFDPVWNNGKK